MCQDTEPMVQFLTDIYMDRSGLYSYEYGGIQLTFIKVKLQGLFAHKALAEGRVHLRSLEESSLIEYEKLKCLLAQLLV